MKFIASGAYGNIYSAYSKKDKKDLCLKIIDIPKMKFNYKKNSFKTNYKDDLDNEIKILQLFSKYSNSLKYYGNYDNKDNNKVIILEKYDGDLEKYMEQRNRSLNTEKIKEIFTGLNKVFRAMYKKNIIHRDLKLSNLLIKYEDKNKENFVVKLGDYGLGKFLNKGHSVSGLKGTPETGSRIIIRKN